MSTFIILWLIWACMAAIIAGKKGHSAVSFFAGLILGVFGVLLGWWQDDLTKAEPPQPNHTWPRHRQAGFGALGTARRRGGRPRRPPVVRGSAGSARRPSVPPPAAAAARARVGRPIPPLCA